jgi:hypothetical protein
MRVQEQPSRARLHGLSATGAAHRRARETMEVPSTGADDRVRPVPGQPAAGAFAAARDRRVVLDEPFRGWTGGGGRPGRVLRRQTTNHGVPVVFSGHQLELVERLCDGVVLIDRAHRGAGFDRRAAASRERRLLRRDHAAWGWFESVRRPWNPGCGRWVLLLEDGVRAARTGPRGLRRRDPLPRCVPASPSSSARCGRMSEPRSDVRTTDRGCGWWWPSDFGCACAIAS